MTMPEYMNKEVFLSSMGLTGDETKYGNRDTEHQHRSYSTYMSYEIMDSVDDSIVEEELAPVRHGRWITTSGEVFPGSSQFLCYSHKHEECGFQYVDMNENEYDFCPHCGAKMDGGEKDG